MTQTEKQVEIDKIKVQAFDALQMIERGKYIHNNLMQELIKLEQTPVEPDVKDETDGIHS